MSKIRYVTDTIETCSEISDNITKHFTKKKIGLYCKCDIHGINLVFNQPTLNYSILEDIYKVLKNLGYRYKMQPLKCFLLLKKDKTHRIKIALCSDGCMSIYLIPEVRDVIKHE